MATVVRMPAVMAGATEAALQAWLVAVGDAVEAGQTIAEIETEKAVFEHEAEASGTVAGLLVAPGEAVAVGTPIAVLADEGESPDAALAAAGSRADPAPPREAPASPAPAHSGGEFPAVPDSADRIFASPLVRRIARERGLDLAAVRGTGPGGRIVRRDVEQLVGDGLPDGSAPPPAPAPSSGAAADGHDASPPPPGAAADGRDASPRAAAEPVVVPLTPMRRAIARRLTESKATVPHFYLRADCRVDGLLDLRRTINADREHPVTLNDLLVRAVAAALREVPDANAVWTDAGIQRFSDVDLAVAVALDDGLVTPVVRSVDRLALGELSATLRDLIDRARAGRLRQHELEGGSFSITNLGMYGTREFAAIINPPHAGILAIGAAEQRPVAVDGELAVATVMTVTLSADHRVLDGALAARWLAAFTALVENPVRILV
ncbi:dihydrolipoamide acetyltransferase family protein [Microbacterium sp. BK668]|uniref:dihydrolipoamide acetyltransferase family protein n=1 Tax=Microbacterium sp. BK668 TaxID=2512118 RepID=UPI0010608646|nr:dihydrolipoamide acetyltransferase family protein [Microbacterium sp. BK668]TDN92172.1 pyruvate dehydrogenase E2 component (dihydrolipoamide acetyltransferase) [Microbacterium sp. BK668]